MGGWHFHNENASHSNGTLDQAHGLGRQGSRGLNYEILRVCTKHGNLRRFHPMKGWVSVLEL